MTYALTNQLPAEIWTLRAQNHILLVEPIANAFLNRRALGLAHPVHDFLFTYYNFSPSKLKQWVPSFEESLIFEADLFNDHPWLSEHWFCLEKNFLLLDRKRITENTHKLAFFIANLSDNILERPQRFGCFGLHEWAMVYKLPPETLRHKGYCLRLSSKDLADFVETQTICCSHYDAFRFFTEEARPLNTLNPVLETRLKLEQGGCVHANIDLYKWSTKLWPWIGSDFIAKTFLLALEGRELDMRASPYDLSDEGFLPICIETEEGRKYYQTQQQLFAEKAFLLRKELRERCERFLSLPVGKKEKPDFTI